MNITREEFKWIYSAELLPTSKEEFALGDIWNWNYDLFFYNPYLVNVEQNIAQIVRKNSLHTQLKNATSLGTLIPNIDLTSDVKEVTSIKIIPLNDLNISTYIESISILEFSFEKISIKTIDQFRQQIVTDLERLKQNDFSTYKHHIKTNQIVVTLFYCDFVIIKVDTNLTKTHLFKDFLIENELSFESQVDNYHNETIKIAVCNRPFAAKFMSGREF